MANNNQDFSAPSSEASVLSDESQEHATFTDSLVDQENVKSPQEEKDTIKLIDDILGNLVFDVSVTYGCSGEIGSL